MSDYGRFMFGVGAVMEHRPTGRILIQQKKNKNAEGFNEGSWEMIYGRKNPIETIPDAITREVREESGITDFKIKKALRIWHFFRGDHVMEKEILGVTFWCQTDTDHIILSDEHQAHKWVTPEEALTYIEMAGLRYDIEMFMNERDNRNIALTTPDESKIFTF